MANTSIAPANYGDVGNLEKLSSGTKQQYGSYGPTVQRNPGGRPPSNPQPTPQAEPQAAPQAAPAAPPLPTDQQALIDNYARAKAAAEKWEFFANAADAGPWTRWYAEVAQKQVLEAAEALHRGTPNFIG